jgi:DNA-binding MarR family transcriptional regulator
MSSHEDGKPWTFLSNHMQVLLCLVRDPDALLRDVGDAVGIRERAAQRIVADLVESGYVQSERIGRRNRYVVNRHAIMRHPAQADYEIGQLLNLLAPTDT